MADNNTSTNTPQGGATAQTSQNTANTGTGERTFSQADVDRMIAELCDANRRNTRIMTRSRRPRKSWTSSMTTRRASLRRPMPQERLGYTA